MTEKIMLINVDWLVNMQHLHQSIGPLIRKSTTSFNLYLN